MLNSKNLINKIVILLFVILLIGCSSRNRLGMIEDTNTGIQYGSIVERSFFIDSSELENNMIKLSARNVSGDRYYDISSFKSSLKNKFIEKGFDIANNQNFGMKFDIVIEYSGQIQQDMSLRYGFLGGAAGGIMGYKSNAKASEAVGALGGATLGAIIGSYIVDDTYIVMVKVNIGIVDVARKGRKTIVFNSSPEIQEDTYNRTFYQEIKSTRIAVFAGGRNLEEAEVIEGVKQRLLSIISDII